MKELCIDVDATNAQGRWVMRTLLYM